MEENSLPSHLEAFVHHHPYYTEKWSKRSFSWNWGAALFGEIWMIYRKMYLYAALFILLDVLYAVIFFLIMGDTEVPLVDTVFFLLQRVVLGFFANVLYYLFAVRKLNRAYGKNPDVSLSQLRKMGGVSPNAVYLTIFVGICVRGVLLFS